MRAKDGHGVNRVVIMSAHGVQESGDPGGSRMLQGLEGLGFMVWRV